jgi:hypothetical protein
VLGVRLTGITDLNAQLSAWRRMGPCHYRDFPRRPVRWCPIWMPSASQHVMLAAKGAAYRRLLALSIPAIVTLLSGCERPENSYVAPPPPEVRVAFPVQRQVTRYLEATGRTAPVNSAHLVARVSGFLKANRHAAEPSRPIVPVHA